ncbi:hypothetical protein D3C73_1126070 [compost metagenome]
MAITVIDAFEKINVQQYHRERGLAGGRFAQLLTAQLHEVGAVVNAGQAVYRGQLPQLLLKECPLRHIDQHNHSSGQAAVLFQDRGRADLIVAGAAANIPG